MAEIQLGVIEARYADMIWAHEPVTSSELVKMTAVEFNWKRTTAHNVLRRLIDKGLFRNENGVVTAVISRDEFYSMQSRQYVEDAFGITGAPDLLVSKMNVVDSGLIKKINS